MRVCDVTRVTVADVVCKLDRKGENSFRRIVRVERYKKIVYKRGCPNGRFATKYRDDSSIVLIDDQEQILSFVPSPDVRIDVRSVFTLQAAVRTMELWLAAAHRTQMRDQCSLVLVSLGTLWANIVPGLDPVLRVPLLDPERGIHEASSGQVPLQVALRRVRTVAEVASIFLDVAVTKRCWNTQATLNVQIFHFHVPPNRTKFSTRYCRSLGTARTSSNEAIAEEHDLRERANKQRTTHSGLSLGSREENRCVSRYRNRLVSFPREFVRLTRQLSDFVSNGVLFSQSERFFSTFSLALRNESQVSAESAFESFVRVKIVQRTESEASLLRKIGPRVL